MKKFGINLEKTIYAGMAVGAVCYIILASTGYDIFEVLELLFGNMFAQYSYYLFVLICVASALFVVYMVARGIMNAEKDLRDD